MSRNYLAIMENKPTIIDFLESEIFDLLLADKSMAEIAEKVGRTHATVNKYLQILREKYEVQTNHGLILAYLKTKNRLIILK